MFFMQKVFIIKVTSKYSCKINIVQDMSIIILWIVGVFSGMERKYSSKVPQIWTSVEYLSKYT